MITNAQRASLRSQGHTDESINRMTPAEAHAMLSRENPGTPDLWLPEESAQTSDEALDRVLRRLPDAKQQSDGQYRAKCPAHEDRNPSLSVCTGVDGRVLLHCHAGCKTTAILDALNLVWGDIYPRVQKNVPKAKSWTDIAAYDYRDAHGSMLYQVLRQQNGTDKRFRQRRPDGNGGWVWNLNGVDRVLYRLPDLLAADPAKPVFVVEGEKDADRLASLGLAATCSPHGAGKWREDYNVHLRDRRIIVIPDNDPPGQRHARQVAKNLVDVAASVQILELPDLPEHGDVSKWLDNGGDPADLMVLANNAPTKTEWLTEQPAEQPECWQWRSLEEAYEPRPSRQYVVDSLVHE
jgi:hypothetical protein